MGGSDQLTAWTLPYFLSRQPSLFGTPQGSPRTDKLIDASIQWAERIMKRIDTVCGKDLGCSGRNRKRGFENEHGGSRFEEFFRR
jgi:hypothetical protein